MSLLLDVCWDRIVGRGKVGHKGWLLGKRGIHLFYLSDVAHAFPYRI